MLPLLLGGAALMGGGTALGMAGANSAQNATNDQMNRQVNRLSGFQSQNMDTFRNSLGLSSYPAAQQQISQGRDQYLANYNQHPLFGFNIPNRHLGQAMGRVGQDAQNRLMAGNRANQFGYANYGFQQGLKDLAAGQQFDVTNRLAANTMAPFQASLQDAAHSGDTQMGIGSLMNTLGSLGIMASMLPAKAPVSSVSSPQSAGAMTGGWAASPQAAPLWYGFYPSTLNS